MPCCLDFSQRLSVQSFRAVCIILSGSPGLKIFLPVPSAGCASSHPNHLWAFLYLQHATEGNGVSWIRTPSFPGMHLSLQHSHRCQAQAHTCVMCYELLLLSCWCTSLGVCSTGVIKSQCLAAGSAPCSVPQAAGIAGAV